MKELRVQEEEAEHYTSKDTQRRLSDIVGESGDCA